MPGFPTLSELSVFGETMTGVFSTRLHSGRSSVRCLVVGDFRFRRIVTTPGRSTTVGALMG